MSHCFLLGWLHVVKNFPLYLTWVACVAHVFHCPHMVALCHLRFPHLLTLVSQCSFGCPKATQKRSAVLYLVSYCCLVGCFWIIPSVTLSIWGGFVSFQEKHLAHWHRSASSQVSHCHSQMWFHIVAGFSMQCTGVALHHLRRPTASHCGNPLSFRGSHSYWSGSTSYQVYHCHLLGWLCVVPGVSLTFTCLCFLPSVLLYQTGLQWCHLKSLTATH